MASTARLDELKKKFEENPRRYFAPLANEHRKSGDLDQAIALCRAHLPQQPAHISGHIVLAQALFEAGGLDEAREIFHTALGLDPENLIALRYLGDIARDSDDVTTARQWYQRVLEVDPRNEEIVQLVRDLDAPPAEVEALEAAPSTAQADAAEPPTPARRTAENNPRFAPLSLEPMDLDTGDLPAAATPEGKSNASSADASLDVHAAWKADSPTVDLPMIDAPEIDPFDLHPSASAESLFDASAEAPADDFFLTELSQPVVPDEEIAQPSESEFAAADSWFPAAETRAAVPASPSEPEASTFEEGSFYLEPPPAAPADAGSSAQASVESSQADDGVWDTPNAPAEVPIDSASAEPKPTFEAAGNVEALTDAGADSQPAALASDLADSPTAEWHAPSPSAEPTNDLGLEVMEFVPPSRDLSIAQTPAPAPDADPMLGHMPELLPTDQGATPASFVTETMAELYLQQGFRNEALAVYRELLSRNPADANLRERVQQIESGSMSSIGMATLSENVVESALKRQSARPARSVRSFFASFAGRRAPAPEPREVDASAASDAFNAEDIAVEPAPGEPTEFAASMPESSFSADPAPDSGGLTPAAETLATFDPFADPGNMAPDVSVAPAAEILPSAEPAPITPNVQAVTPPSASAATSMEPSAARRSLEDLFPDSPITARTESVAQTLATAFGRQEPQGRPTRAASSELSLDNVFRGAPEGTPPADGGFSFDQFFSDARPAGSDIAAAISPPETGRSGGGAGDAHDIEQFTAWLEGLKKK